MSREYFKGEREEQRLLAGGEGPRWDHGVPGGDWRAS